MKIMKSKKKYKYIRTLLVYVCVCIFDFVISFCYFIALKTRGSLLLQWSFPFIVQVNMYFKNKFTFFLGLPNSEYGRHF